MEDLTEWQKHVLRELSDIKESQAALTGRVAGVEVKASVWGFIGGLIPFLSFLGIKLGK